MFSIIIPVAEDHLEKGTANLLEVVRCVQEQTFTDYELIVVGQYKGKPLWKRELKDSASQLIAIKGKVPSPAWCLNVGARVASGEFLVVLDPSAVFGSDYFSSIVSFLEENSLCSYLVGYNEARYLFASSTQGYLSGGKDKKSLLEFELHQSSIADDCGRPHIFERNFFLNELGGYNEGYRDPSYADKEIILRASALADGWNSLTYTITRLYGERESKFAEESERLFAFSRAYPREVSALLVDSRLGEATKRKVIDIESIDVKAVALERAQALTVRNEKYSFQNFSNKKFLDATDLRDTLIIGSCFYQLCPPEHKGDTRVQVFPDTMQNVTFIECNLDNVYIPPGNIVDRSCSRKRIKHMFDGRPWMLNDASAPIEPTDKADKDLSLSLGDNIDPNNIPSVRPTRNELLAQRIKMLHLSRELRVERDISAAKLDEDLPTCL